MSRLVASNIMARTTLDIDRMVLEQLRTRAVEERKSMGQVASEMLAPAFADGSPGHEPRPLAWASKDMGRPRIDLEDKEAVWQLLDQEQLEKDAG
jgi:DNA invertase Pin-like site-specific DNA recombinase